MPQPEVLHDTMLRACVELELRYPQARSLMVTGPFGGEGTTTVACLLARLLAETNDVSVVLVDANLRSPGVHRRLSIPAEPGLRDWEPSSPDSGVHPVREYRHLSILPVGKDNGRSIQYLSHTGRLQQLGDWLKQNYRFVLWDTPSLIRYAEGRFLLRHVDGVVVVVEADKTARDLLVQLRDSLTGNCKLLGVIMNRAGRYSLFGGDALYDRPRSGSPE